MCLMTWQALSMRVQMCLMMWRAISNSPCRRELAQRVASHDEVEDVAAAAERAQRRHGAHRDVAARVETESSSSYSSFKR